MDQDAMDRTITVKYVCKGCQAENERIKCRLELEVRTLKHVATKLKQTKEELKEERRKREALEKENEKLTDKEVHKASTSAVTRYNKTN